MQPDYEYLAHLERWADLFEYSRTANGSWGPRIPITEEKARAKVARNLEYFSLVVGDIEEMLGAVETWEELEQIRAYQRLRGEWFSNISHRASKQRTLEQMREEIAAMRFSLLEMTKAHQDGFTGYEVQQGLHRRERLKFSDRPEPFWSCGSHWLGSANCMWRNTQYVLKKMKAALRDWRFQHAA